jgi:hypothetical protein
VNHTTDPSSRPPTPAFPRREIVRRLLRWTGIALLGLIVTGMLLWATAAVYYADTHRGPRTIRAALVALAALASLIVVRPRRRGLAAFALLFAAVLGWYLLLKPSNDRDWAPEVARTPWAQIEGERVAVHDIRNFDYRTETDFTPNWVDRYYDLSKIRSADLMLVYWGSPAIAHAMVSFGFDDGQYLAVSIETRKERTESYSTVEGLFRQFELIYVFADERDVVRLRTNYRKGEDVYLYRTTLPRQQVREAFISYLDKANELRDHPAFYNAVTSNCATNVLVHARAGGSPGKLTTDVLLSGYAADQAYRNRRLDTRLPFDELRRRSLINPAARAADTDPEFSKTIRAGRPDPANVATETSAE